MSNNLRHFLFPDGRVRTMSGYIATPPASSGASEVQVVPLDAIVIRRDELPEVYADKSVVAGPVATARDEKPDDAMRHALGFLAIAEHLREHPPVDEKQVKAIANLIGEAVDSGISVNATDGSLERFLVKRGVRVEQS